MIGERAVIDASVAVDYLIGARYAGSATRLFRGLVEPEGGPDLWAPDLLYVEGLSALRRLVRMGAIDESAGARAVGHLARLPLHVTGSAGLLAGAWALRATLTAYDACYVALARRLDAPMVTGDGRLARALRGGRDRVVFLGDL